MSADQTTKASPFTRPYRESDRLTRLPTAQMTAARTVRTKPASGNEAPLCAPITASPMAATKVPASCGRRGRSPNTSAASSTVKKTCDCWTTEASPEGIPILMARKRSPNWPKKDVRANPAKTRNGSCGRRTKKMAGKAVNTIRSPPRTNGETPRSPTLMTAKLTPQSRTTSRASATSRGRKAGP